MDGVILQQGRFTSTGEAKQLNLRSDLDWMVVYNYTQMADQQTPGRAVKFYWQRGMGQDAIVTTKGDGGDDLNGEVVEDVFTLVDTSSNAVGALDTTVTAVSNAARPVVTVTSTSGLSDGDIVRMINVNGAEQIGGFDFTIDVLGGTTFELSYMSQIVAGTTGSFRLIKFEPMFYPRHRYISSITQASQAVVQMTVTHAFTVGQKVRFKVPADYGMIEMDGLLGTITAVSTDLSSNVNTITVDIDSSAFTAFAFPTDGVNAFSPALVIPVGEAAEEDYTNLLDDATRNTSFIGMELEAGILSPAGSLNDVIYWMAGKSFNVDNE